MRNENPAQQTTTKECGDCHKQVTRDGFAKKQWRDAKKKTPSCRLCAEYTKICQDKSRACRDCKLKLHRTEYAIFQWGKGDEARCHSCVEKLKEIFKSRFDDPKDDHTEQADGILLCKHSKESCDICMVDFTLMNDFTRKRTEVGREDLTQKELDGVIEESMKDCRISKKICIMDGHAVCPRTSEKLRCLCDEVTYCSEACQKHHWTIHKMTCKSYVKKDEKKAKKKAKKGREKHEQQQQAKANDLTEEQKDNVRILAFFAENNGGTHSIAECAWQLGEHPFVIGGGNIIYGRNGEEFIKGDVAKIYRERLGVEWDGSPRFGMGPYVQQKPAEDWIARARTEKTMSQRLKDFHNENGM